MINCLREQSVINPKNNFPLFFFLSYRNYNKTRRGIFTTVISRENYVKSAVLAFNNPRHENMENNINFMEF